MNCQHNNTETVDTWYDEGILVEYTVKCVECNKPLTHYSYGSEENLLDEEDESNE